MIEQGSPLWNYLSRQQQQLAADGVLLYRDRGLHPNESLSDYSYLVFPFSKLYEGFLKQLFRDLEIIGDREYNGDHFRVGKVLSPNLVRLLRGKSAYGLVTKRFGQELADELWIAWKQGRNMVFHYFPHNLRRLSFVDATVIIELIVHAMNHAVSVTHVHGRD